MEHLYVISYDISDDKRWRRVFRIMKGHGEWLQYSVFQCRLDRQRYVQIQAELNEVIHHLEDHVLILDLGPVDSVNPHVTSLGKRFELLRREARSFDGGSSGAHSPPACHRRTSRGLSYPAASKASAPLAKPGQAPLAETNLIKNMEI